MLHPSIRDLFLRLNRDPAFQEVVRRLPETASLAGLTTTARAIYSVLLWQVTERPLLIVVDGNKQAEALFEAIETFFPLLNPSREGDRPQTPSGARCRARSGHVAARGNSGAPRCGPVPPRL